MEHKTVPSFIKAVDQDQGIVEHIFAVFGNVDSGLDVLHPGSFKKTIQERQKKVRVLDQHNTDSINRVLGKPLEIREIGASDLPMEVKSEFPDAVGGVWAKTQFFMDTPEGKGAFIRLREGGIDEWSFGYDAVDTDFGSVALNGKKTRVRNIRQLKLYEYSPVLFGMNPATTTLDAKQEKKPEVKAVTPYQDYPLAARDYEWDNAKAEGRVRAWAGGDEPDWAEYAKAFMWHDGDNDEIFGAYKLGYVDIIDDKPHAVPRALMSISNPARGLEATDGPTDSEKERIQSHVSKYYAKMREEFDDDTLMPSWEKSDQPVAEEKLVNLSQQVEDIRQAFMAYYNPPNSWDYWVNAVYDEFLIVTYEGRDGVQWFQVTYSEGEDGYQFAPRGEWVEGEYEFMPEKSRKTNRETKMMDARLLGNTLQGSLHYTFNQLVDKCLMAGHISVEDHAALNAAFDEAVGLFTTRAPDEVMNLTVGEYYYEMGYYSADPDIDQKAGRTLSASNAAKIQEALAKLTSVLMNAGLIQETSMMDEEEDDEEKSNTKSTNGPQLAPELLQQISIEQEELDLIRLK